MIDKIELFNKEIKLRTHYCNLFDKPGIDIIDPYINIYVITENCNANCSFCTYKNNGRKWNGEKYKEIIEHILSKIEINKIGVSGGEPTLNWDIFTEITNLSKELSPISELSLNTNGFNLEKLFSNEIYKKYDYIQISRHHYDDRINDEIFKCKTPSSEYIKSISLIQTHPHQIQFRCNLIKGYIDSIDEVFKFLDWSNHVEINDIGLVSLMPVNDFSRDNFIYFNINDLVGDNFFLTKKWARYEGGCECFNYVYLPENDFRRHIRVYHKNMFNPSGIIETLTFDGENLRSGFNGEIIY